MSFSKQLNNGPHNNKKSPLTGRDYFPGDLQVFPAMVKQFVKMFTNENR